MPCRLYWGSLLRQRHVHAGQRRTSDRWIHSGAVRVHHWAVRARRAWSSMHTLRRYHLPCINHGHAGSCFMVWGQDHNRYGYRDLCRRAFTQLGKDATATSKEVCFLAYFVLCLSAANSLPVHSFGTRCDTLSRVHGLPPLPFPSRILGHFSVGDNLLLLLLLQHARLAPCALRQHLGLLCASDIRYPRVEHHIHTRLHYWQICDVIGGFPNVYRVSQ